MFFVSAALILVVLSFGGSRPAWAAMSATTTLASCSSPMVGASSTCTATVTGSSPTGTVTWSITAGSGSFTAGATCNLNSGSCTVSYTASTTTPTTLNAAYGGDSSNMGSSGQTSFTPSKGSSTISVSCSPVTVFLGTSTSCTATVSGIGTGTVPGGSVVMSSSGANLIAGCTLASGTCASTYAPASTDQGVTITASYGGDSNFNAPASGPVTFQIYAAVHIAIGITILGNGPLITIPLAGCNVSPGSVASGSVSTVSAFPGCTFAAVLPSTPTSRYFSTAGTAQIGVPTCTSEPCPAFSASAYYQLLATYSAVANDANWDAGLTLGIVGSNLGVQGFTVCQITPFQGTSSQVCSGFSDYDATVTFPLNASGAATNTRWQSLGNANAFTDVTGGNTHVVNYYKQVREQFSYSIAGAGSPGSPTFTCTEYGSTIPCLPLATSPNSYWLDFGSTWSATNPLSGSGSTERWDSLAFSGTASAGTLMNIAYYHQFLLSVSYSVPGGGTLPGTPSLSYPSHGATLTATLATSSSNYWMDAGQSFTVTSSLAGASGERWSAPSSSYVVSQSASVIVALYHQYAIGLSYTLKGGGTGFVTPSLSYTAFGAAATSSLQAMRTPYWADASTGWTLSNPLLGSGPSERWQANQTVSGIATVPYNSSLVYYHQFLETLSYTVVGGGAGYDAPTTTVSEFGNIVKTTSGWMDAGAAYTFTNPLVGSTQTERWFGTPATGTISSAGTLQVTFYHQYGYFLSYSVVDGGTGFNNPQLSFTSVGAPSSQQLVDSTSVFWLDANSQWTLAAQLPGSASGERWMTNQTITGTSIVSVKAAYLYYHQFQGILSYSVVGGGSPKAPNLNLTSFGISSLAPLTNQKVSFWVDATSHWYLPNLLGGSTTHERWIANASLTGPAVSPFTKDLSYLHQYFVKVGVDSLAGGSFNNVTRWYNQADRASLNATVSNGWKFAFWKGLGAGAYNGTAATEVFAVGGPANETAMFYPGLTVVAANDGTVTYHYGSVTSIVQSGAQMVFYPPLGSNVTLTAEPNSVQLIFTGWTGALTGAHFQRGVIMTSPVLVHASFGLDYPDIQVFSIASIAIAVATVYVFVIHRRTLPTLVK